MRRRRFLPSLLLGAVAAGFVVCLAVLQVTGPVAAPRLLGRLAAATIELDRWLPAHRDDIEASARERPRVSIEITGLPISVFVASTAVQADGGSQLRPAVAGAMGHALYDNGRAAYEGNGGISVTEPARWTMDFLRPGVHRFWGAVALALLTLTVISSAVAAISTEGSALPGVLKPIVAGGGFVAASAALFWVVFRVAELLTGPSITGEVLLIGRDVAGVALRDGFAICLGAGAILMLLRIASSGNGNRAPAWPRSGQAV